MWLELYTAEKLRELEEERLGRRSRHLRQVPTRARPLAAPALRRVGRTLRRLGEGLEAWGAGRPEGAADGESA